MDVAEPPGGNGDVFWSYLDVAMDFGRWQCRHSRAQAVTWVASLGQMYLEAMRRRVALIPGCAAPWRWSKTCLRSSSGTRGRKVPVEASPKRDKSPTCCVTMRRPGWFLRVCTCGQRICRRAMSLRLSGLWSVMAAQMAADPGGEAVGWDNASATTLDLPGTWSRSVVYSAMKASCLCWRPDHGGETLCRAATSGLWSVHS